MTNRPAPMSRRTLLTAGLGLAVAAATPRLFAERRKGFFAEHGLPIGLQLFTLGETALNEDLEGTFTRIAAIGYRAIEIAGLRAGTAAQMRAAADKAGLAITSVHIGANPAMAQGKLTVQDNAARLAAELRTLGCRDVVVPFPLLPPVKPENGEDLLTAMRRAFRTSTEHWKRTATLLNERGAVLQREGLVLSYHNHDIDFLPVGGTSGWDILVAETDPRLVSFEVDAGWVVAGGRDPVTLVEGLAGRVCALHVKDLHAPAEPRAWLKMDSTEVGSGVVDWKKLLPTAWRAGVRQFYVEQEPPFKLDRFESIARSYDYLSRL